MNSQLEYFYAKNTTQQSMDYKMIQEFQPQGQVSKLGATTSHHKKCYCKDKRTSNLHVSPHILFLGQPFVPHIQQLHWPWDLAEIHCQQTVQTVLKIQAFPVCFPYWCLQTMVWGQLIPHSTPLGGELQKKFKLLHLTSKFKPIFRKQEKQTKQSVQALYY